MSSDFSEKEKKTLCFRFAFDANYTRHQALTFAQHSFPQAVFEEVDRAYNKFNLEKTAKRELNRKPDTSQKIDRASLEGMPSELLEKVFENSSSDDQKTLHKTSYSLSNYIENNFKTYKEIRVYVDQETIRTRFNEQKPAVTRHSQIGGKRKLEEDEESISQESFHNIPDLVQNLGKVLNERNVKIQEFAITTVVEIDMEKRTSELFSGLQKVFDAMRNKIHVGDLEITVPTVGFLMSVLEKIKVGHLTNLTIHETTKDASLDCNVLIDSPHWPHLKTFRSRNINVTVLLDQTYHMIYACFKNTAITIEDILKLRDRLVQNPKDFLITIKCKHLNATNLIESLKPFLPSKDLSQNNCGVYQCANKWELNFLCFNGDFLDLECKKTD